MNKGLASIAFLISAAVLAGCSDAPPSGEFELGASTIVTDGTSTVVYTPFNDPMGLAQSDSPSDPACVNRPEGIPGVQPCQDPETYFSVMFASGQLSEPDQASGYAVFAVGNTETIPIGDLIKQGDGSWMVNNTFNANYDGQLQAIELRMGNVVVATAAATSGSAQSFATHPDLLGVTGSGSYSGKELTVTVAGIPSNVTAIGWLVSVDENENLVHSVSFPISNGENTYEAAEDVGTFAEFHIHAGASKLNMGIAQL